MSLAVVGTPIGHAKDISLRAIEVLRNSDVIIGEERKALLRILKSIEIDPAAKQIYFLNEHSAKSDLNQLAGICRSRKVALVSDCGTPGFCDPGADLVDHCRKAQVEIVCVPGPSSLTALISICGQRLDQFLFRGFLPAKRNERIKEIKSLAAVRVPVILMETPYRARALLEELAQLFPERICTLGWDLTGAQERVLKGKPKAILAELTPDKKPFVLILN